MPEHSVNYRRNVSNSTLCDMCLNTHDISITCMICNTSTILCADCFKTTIGDSYSHQSIYYVGGLESRCDIPTCKTCRDKKIDICLEKE